MSHLVSTRSTFWLSLWLHSDVVMVAQTKAAPLSLQDFCLSKVTCPLPQPLLGTPVPSHGDKNDEQWSRCLDKKNKMYNMPTSKRAKYRMFEALGELSEVSKAKGLEQKMQAYPDMYKKLLSPQVIEALSSLADSREVKIGPLRIFFRR
ncbi:hypothetical protein D1007_34576 [Hordeum vulgare]|nr:hypothetical protein D1007_34576 [Hordeum vulgare]